MLQLIPLTPSIGCLFYGRNGSMAKKTVWTFHVQCNCVWEMHFYCRFCWKCASNRIAEHFAVILSFAFQKYATERCLVSVMSTQCIGFYQPIEVHFGSATNMIYIRNEMNDKNTNKNVNDSEMIVSDYCNFSSCSYDFLSIKQKPVRALYAMEYTIISLVLVQNTERYSDSNTSHST